jgi:hypothetical protein
LNRVSHPQQRQRLFVADDHAERGRIQENRKVSVVKIKKIRE